MELNYWISSYLSVTNFIDSGAFVTSLDFRSKSTIGHFTSFGDGRHGTGFDAIDKFLGYGLSYVELLS